MFNERKLLLFFILGICLSSQESCSSYNHQVIAATGTSIGVEVSQNPATQVPQGKLGYQRTELAIVPTNRAAEKTATSGNSMGDGASDHGEVIMELRYGGIFDMGKSSGIYQRLAVGKIAVTQPGASFMFAKDDEGELKGNTAEAVAKTAEATAFAEKLSGKAGLSSIAFLRDIYANLQELGRPTPPKGRDDAKARDIVGQLDNLVKNLPDKYQFNNYIEPEATVVRTNPKKDDSIAKAGMTFNLVLNYQDQLVNSTQLLEGLIKRPRNTFTINCSPPILPETVPPLNCDSGIPDTTALSREHEEQKLYLKNFTEEWGKQDIVLKAVDYYIYSLKK
ncbi:MAG: hypothetical protein QM706_02480 [Nitrospira sp.]